MAHQTQAIKPDLFGDFRKVLTDNEAKDKPIQDKEELQLYSLSVTDGWRILKEFIEHLKTDVDGINQQSMQSGASFEDIGKNAVVVQLTKDLLNRVIQKVEDVREARESRVGDTGL